MSDLTSSDEYRDWIVSIESRVHSSQTKAAVAVNYAMLELYWFLGEQIIERQETAKWGDGFLKQMSLDLLTESPGMKGFSRRNLEYMRQWVVFWRQLPELGRQPVGQLEISSAKPIAKQVVSQSQPLAKQLVSQIPWGHNVRLFQRIHNPSDALFYVQKTIENHWSRAVLTHQIESGLDLRQGKAVNNFEATLPQPESDLAQQLLRDPYNFDFLTLTDRHNERELENGLVDHLSKFLLELGAGFAFVGRQYKLTVDSQVRAETDGPTIGILICKSKSGIVVEYSLRDVTKPIGVSEYQITQTLPDELRSSLPSIEEIEAELLEMNDEQ